jgi:hypothetical protein
MKIRYFPLVILFVFLMVVLFIYVSDNLYTKLVFKWDKSENVLSNTDRFVAFTVPQSMDTKTLKVKEADLNKDGINEEYHLEEGLLSIKEGSSLIWTSPVDWYIDDFILADVTNDGVIDISMSLWKPGNFGYYKPFWVSENDMSIKNHFFVYDFTDELIPVWHSSNLDNKNQELLVTDIDNDTKNELIVIEQSYDNYSYCKDNYISIWRWNSWGFSNVWKSRTGNYCNLAVESVNEIKQIIVESKTY